MALPAAMTSPTAAGAPGGAWAVPPGFVRMPLRAERASWRRSAASWLEIAGELERFVARPASRRCCSCSSADSSACARSRRASRTSAILQPARLHRGERVRLLGDGDARGPGAVHDPRLLLADALEEVGLLEQVGEALRLDDDGDEVGLRVAVGGDEVRAQRVVAWCWRATRRVRRSRAFVSAVSMRSSLACWAAASAWIARRRRCAVARPAEDARIFADSAATAARSFSARFCFALILLERSASRGDRHGRGGAERQRADEEESAEGDGRHRRSRPAIEGSMLPPPPRRRAGDATSGRRNSCDERLHLQGILRCSVARVSAVEGVDPSVRRGTRIHPLAGWASTWGRRACGRWSSRRTGGRRARRGGAAQRARGGAPRAGPAFVVGRGRGGEPGGAARGRAGARAGVATCATSGTILLVDGAGGPLTPGVMYDDARGGGAGGEARAACRATRAACAARLRWMLDAWPEAGARGAACAAGRRHDARAGRRGRARRTRATR